MTRLKIILIHGFILASFIPTLYYNILHPLTNPRKIPIHAFRDGKLTEKQTEPGLGLEGLQKAYWRATRPILKMSRSFALSTAWRMFSPSWKQFYWIEWQAESPEGNWVPLETQDLSPQDRRNRHWLTARSWDFKRGRLQSSMLHSQEIREAYAKWLCRQLPHRLGWKPKRVRAIWRNADIPRPNQPQGWSPMKTPMKQRVLSGSMVCDP